MDRLCKNCAKFYDRKEKVCPFCGTPAKSTFKDIKKIASEKSAKKPARVEVPKENKEQSSKETTFDNDIIVFGKELKESAVVQENSKPQDLAKEQEILDSQAKEDGFVVSPTQDIRTMSEEDRDKIKYVSHRKRNKNLQKTEDIKVDGLHIDVKSSLFEDNQPKNRYQSKGEYSAKKARGDYALEKLQWWEIYRWADRVLTRRKIKKVVNKEATKKPESVSFWTLLVLCLCSGFLGMHNIYAKNYGKGFTMLGFFLVSFVVIMLAETVPFFALIQLSIGGFSGMVVMVMWLWDLFAIIFKKFKFRTTKLEFIRSLDVETRAKLGTKYI